MAAVLPIFEVGAEIDAAARTERRVIVSAPTGSGKSTQVPQILMDSGAGGLGQIVVLQPRRLAARLLAARVAWERNAQLGGEVGYQIRFENHTGPNTRLRFVTEGVLLRQMLQDPKLRGVTTLIFDEFHERHLYGDITLAHALDLQASTRPDLVIVVMSATLDAAHLERYLKPCRTVLSEGRTYPVQIDYASTPSYLDKRPIWDQAADAFEHYVASGKPGDLLVFMPGGYEISQTIEAIRRRPGSRGFLVLPLHGELSPRDQDAAVARYEGRKVVVATNVAETSLTIDGIQCVIDSGLARIPRYDSHRGINTLLIEKISRAAADQRAGRAGRTAPGDCLRLWSREEHSHRCAQELPEIKRLDLAEVVLTLKAAGITDLRSFRWLEPPEEQSLAKAEELLIDLGALDTNADPSHPELATITSIGRKILAFPLHPRYGRMLLAAQDFGCVYQACMMAALTQGRDLLLRNVDGPVAQAREDTVDGKIASDFDIIAGAWTRAAQHNFNPETCRRLGLHGPTARQVKPLMEQFLELATREGLDTSRRTPPTDALHKCILIAFSDRVARRLDLASARCELVHGRRGTLARESVVQDSSLLVAAEIREVEGKEKNVDTVLSLATAVDETWLAELFPNDLTAKPRVFYDATNRRVFAEEQLQFRGLAISTRRVEPPPVDDAARLLTDEVLAGRLQLSEWNDAVEQWILRLNLLSQWCPELNLPQITSDDRRHLIEQICHGAFGFKDIKDQPVMPTVQSWVSDEARRLLEKHAPDRLRFANGRSPRVIYDASNPPHIAVRIQEIFDLNTTPRIAMNRVPVLLHILAPSMRPVQITQDLAGFWRDHYPRIKQELKRKYPKHEWR